VSLPCYVFYQIKAFLEKGENRVVIIRRRVNKISQGQQDERFRRNIARFESRKWSSFSEVLSKDSGKTIENVDI
jgi:hypothetical protein